MNIKPNKIPSFDSPPPPKKLVLKKKPKTKDVFKFARIILKSKMIPNRNGFDSFIRKEDVKEAIQTSHSLLEDYLQEKQ